MTSRVVLAILICSLSGCGIFKPPIEQEYGSCELDTRKHQSKKYVDIDYFDKDMFVACMRSKGLSPILEQGCSPELLHCWKRL